MPENELESISKTYDTNHILNSMNSYNIIINKSTYNPTTARTVWNCKIIIDKQTSNIVIQHNMNNYEINMRDQTMIQSFMCHYIKKVNH